MQPYGVLTRWRFIVGGITALAALTGIAFLVGHFAARAKTGYFDWELASIFGTALGTTALAVATGALAYTTSGDVRATWELARLTREDQVQRERPILVMEGTDLQFQEDRKHGELVVSVRNVGLGPALRVAVWGKYVGPKNPVWVESAIFPTILPGESEDIALRLTAEVGEIAGNLRLDEFEVAGEYLDRRQRKTHKLITEWRGLQPPETSARPSA